MFSTVSNLIFSPIVPWPVLAILALAVVGLTLWVYRAKVRGASGRWRWVALGLRMVAIACCLLAAVRPTLILLEKVKVASSIVFLIDTSASMGVADVVGSHRRIDVARRTLTEGRAAAKKLDTRLEVNAYGFDRDLRDLKPNDASNPEGKTSAIGTALAEALKRERGRKVVSIVLLSDGSSNDGDPPLSVAERLRSLQVPVVAVPFGSETAGETSRDLAVRGLDVAPTVFVKNELQVRGTLRVRGYPNVKLDVELFAEGRSVAKASVQARDGAEVVPVALSWVPQDVGEKKLTLQVKPDDRELIKTNNELSTYVNVKKGGLNALYIQGSNFSWEYRFLKPALDRGAEIRVDLHVLRQPARGGKGQLTDEELLPGRYDIYILGDVPADYLTTSQHRALADAVRRGAGLIMLGGRSSFGPGGWGNTALADVLPTTVHPGDPQVEPPGGVRVRPSLEGLENYVMKLGPTRADTERLWAALPPMTGYSDLGTVKKSAFVLARAADGKPVFVGHPVPRGRVLAFGGETWVWARAFEPAIQDAHRKLWRQIILWLAQKEDQGDDQVRLVLDRRRVAVGGKVELSVTALDAKDEPIPGVSFEATVEPANGANKSENVDIFTQGSEARGTYFASGAAGEYRVTVQARRAGQAIGTDSARFDVFQDDRELEDPAADRALMRQIAEVTGGKALEPEELGKYLRSLDATSLTDTLQQKERRLWDNWPFFLVFVAALSAEWWLRKRIGWV